MSTQPHAPARRRSRHELRLEQIAIWGDAAAAYGRGSTVPTASTTRPGAKLNAQPLDLHSLQSAHFDMPEGEMRSGSLSMCHSRSAEVFRRSGKHGAVARASMKQRPDVVPSVHDENDRVVIKRGGMLSKGGYRVERAETRPTSKRPSEKRHSDKRHSDKRKSDRRQSEKKQPEKDKRRKDNTPSVVLKSRRDSKEMRERDENDFRLSNAKLPERVDEPRGALDWAPFRRRRSSVPILGRYTRSSSSQLPSVRPKSLRPFQSASNPS